MTGQVVTRRTGFVLTYKKSAPGMKSSSNPSFASLQPAEPRQVRPITACMNTICIIGFDSAWTGKKGAICALSPRDDCSLDFNPPELADFDEALAYVQHRTEVYDLCIVAVDQPTIVPNETGCRQVDRVAASLVSYIGGGVQPANLFGDAAPFWRFKKTLDARENPEESRSSQSGFFLIEVYPALVLPALNPAFCGRLRGPKYNPVNRRI